jgi:hygromycin-B 4-O-kinase
VRYGHQRDDFDLDRAAFRFNQQGLPVPEVLDIGRAFAGQDLDGDKSGCWYAVSERVFGEPLEQVSATQWSALVPAVATSMEKMRLALPPAAIGWGGWASVSTDGAPIGRHPSWREHLLAVIDEPNDGRIAGWRDNLRANRERQADFDWGFELLDELTGGSLVDSVVRGISHQDMLNRNVHVSGSRITGLFDWGCAAYADHLYELSLFEFWNPWHPEVDVVALRAELEANWQRSGFTAERVAERLRVCHLHNGLVHLMYGAYLENWDTLWQTAERMRDLVGDD